jgi:hypothetical protein
MAVFDAGVALDPAGRERVDAVRRDLVGLGVGDHDQRESLVRRGAVGAPLRDREVVRVAAADHRAAVRPRLVEHGPVGVVAAECPLVEPHAVTVDPLPTASCLIRPNVRICR